LGAASNTGGGCKTADETGVDWRWERGGKAFIRSFKECEKKKREKEKKTKAGGGKNEVRGIMV